MSSGTLTLLLALWAVNALGADCPAPLSFPISQRQIDPNVFDSYMRGIRITIGTPEQTILMNPWPDLNNTIIYDKQLLRDESFMWNDEIALVRRGGVFQYEDSTTFTKNTDLVSAGGAPVELAASGSDSNVSRVFDTFLAGTEHFGGSKDSSSPVTMPIGISRQKWDTGYSTLNALGLGSNSTYLNALVQANKISSRVWSFFWGRQWPSSAEYDGSVVFGGYDEEKVIGKPYTRKLDYSESTGCWTGMKVTITDLILNFENGNDRSIMPHNIALPVCIVPQKQLLAELPDSVIDNLEELTNMVSGAQSYGLYYGGQVYTQSDNPSYYAGDLTIVLQDGLKIQIPNNQLIVPSEEIARNGSFVTEKTRMELPIAKLGSSTGRPATLGRFFFTSAYLMVDHDAETFSLWQANPATKSSLVSITHSTSDTAEACKDGSGGKSESSPGNDGSTGGDSGSSTDSGEASAKSKANVGAIVGGVVGGLAGIALIAATAFLFLRKRRSAAKAISPERSLVGSEMVCGSKSDGGGSYELIAGVYAVGVSELQDSGNHQGQYRSPTAAEEVGSMDLNYSHSNPAEVASQNWVYELDGHRRHAELPATQTFRS